MDFQATQQTSASTSRRAVETTNSQSSLLPSHHQSSVNGESDSGSYYVPPTSELTSSNHDQALGVIDATFKQTDEMLQREMKAFGDNSESIFQELNKIRKKQLALAARHISIETVADDDKSLAPDGKLLDAADKEELDPLNFERKGQELQALMASV
ncbi:hypothetical protein BGX34_002353 [Mortierella sp. NVP85]|nr:hypothetical protein BGX34_002353 [Mortierella sp. NVP85]